MSRVSVSVITVCYNAASTLERTLSSVARQTYDPLEHIIVDGASTDATLDLVRRHGTRISHLISEPDEGIYDAMNKGFSASGGDLFLFLNADDFFVDDGSVAAAIRQISANDKKPADVYHGSVLRYDRETGRGSIVEKRRVNRYSLFRGAIPHPATFYRRAAFEKNGQFDSSFRIAGDYEWAVRGVTRNALTYCRIDSLVAVFCKGGVSSSMETASIGRQERERVISMHYGRAERAWYGARLRLRKRMRIW